MVIDGVVHGVVGADRLAGFIITLVGPDTSSSADVSADPLWSGCRSPSGVVVVDGAGGGRRGVVSTLMVMSG
jgi:hypothetical protein